MQRLDKVLVPGHHKVLLRFDVPKTEQERRRKEHMASRKLEDLLDEIYDPPHAERRTCGRVHTAEDDQPHAQAPPHRKGQKRSSKKGGRR